MRLMFPLAPSGLGDVACLNPEILMNIQEEIVVFYHFCFVLVGCCEWCFSVQLEGSKNFLLCSV